MGEPRRDAASGTAPVDPRPRLVPGSDQWELEKKRRDRLRCLEDLLLAAGKGLANRATWDAYETPTKGQVRAKEAARQWADDFHLDRGEGLLFWGPVGTGKDHLALAAVRQVVLQHDITAHWINGRDMAGEWRDRIDDHRGEAGLLSTLQRRGLLIISDPLPPFGDLSHYQADMLYRVVRARVDNGRPTVCTINVADDDDAEQRLGIPTWDRLTQGSWKIKCDWPSYRTPAKVIE